MKFGIILTTGNIHEMIEMAAEADDAGWDGVFYWDGVAIPGGTTIYDPWVVLAALAMRTTRVRLGNIVTPPSRRRPWKLARETMSVDQLSGGRLVLPVGLGALDDVAFGGVGEATDLRTRAELLDESLEFLTRAWRGEPFSFVGKHFKTAEMTFQPPSMQKPRIPIWVIASWPRPKSVERALRYDGILPQASGAGAPAVVSPDDVRAMAELARQRRPPDAGPWQIVIGDTTPDDDPAAARAKVQSYADAGATWWIESPWMGATVESLRAKIAAGLPQ
jgi:alkanesulfonate monooxygenase SsuD/methylene tetrahydromethanopterin reductase-like flavin-dependent oxidoreductase (luciferase family)